MNEMLNRQIIHVPQNAAKDIRKRLNIPNAPLRISYIGGPGDIVGTYRYWRDGKPDPRVPSITYSSQIYELAKQLEASLQVITALAPPQEETPSVHFTQVIRPAWNGRMQYFRSQAQYMKDAVAKITAFDPHVVIVSLDFPARGWAKLKQGRKLVLTAHNTFWPMGKKPTDLKSRLQLKVLGHRSTALEGAVCTSHECSRQISEVTAGRVNGRVEHPQIFAQYQVQKRMQARKLLYLGRIERSKGIFMLLKAFADLKKQFSDLDLTFAGSGSCNDELSAAIAALDAPNIRFLGLLDAHDVHQQIAQTDLLVCPTMSNFPEGLALVGLEAAAHGIPTLQSSIVPAVDLLGAACKTFRVDDTADLKRALGELLSDDKAYAALIRHLDQVRPRLYDPALSWGSQLAQVLLDLRVGP